MWPYSLAVICTGFFFAYFVFSCLGGYLSIKNGQLGDLLGGLLKLLYLTSSWVPGTDGADLVFKETIARCEF